MSKDRRLKGSLAVVVALALYAVVTSPVVAHGGGHGGGGFHGGGFHGGGFHGGGHHGFHPYRPSQHHFDHHHERHDHHWNHHHHNWHHGGWRPGFWGGTALGYGLGWGIGDGGWGDDGGDTYIDNTTNVSTDADDSDDDDDSNDGQPTVGNSGGTRGFPTDDWPELGINTYAGQYGGTQGQVVVLVVPNSAADKAGVVAGDVILSLNGRPTPSADAMDTILDGANGKFTIEVWDARTGRKSTLSGNLDSNAPVKGKSAAAPLQTK